MSHSKIRVGVCGAAGKMGREVLKTILAQDDMELVMAVDTACQGEAVADLLGNLYPCTVQIEWDLEKALSETKPQVVVDFTAPDAVLNNVLKVVKAGVRSVVGTTGLSAQGLAQIESEVAKQKTGALIVPNFAIGAVLLMKFAQEASRYLDHAEIIEYHHNQKIDAPSGTAFRTADLMAQAQPKFAATNIAPEKEKEILLGSRGGKTQSNLRIHSVRLPGMVAHQEVIFGGVGQTLTIRHDSLDRTSFMPGVALAVRKVVNLCGLVYGLESVL